MKSLTLEQLEELYAEKNGGCHIWVKNLKSGLMHAAIIDMSLEDGIMAIWAKERWYAEADYGTKWVACI